MKTENYAYAEIAVEIAAAIGDDAVAGNIEKDLTYLNCQ